MLNRFFMAALAVFFASAVMAQEVPKPAEKPVPECVKIPDFFQGTDYVSINHQDYPDLMFGYSLDYKVIVLFLMQEKCIAAYEVVKPGHPDFDAIFEKVFAGWLAGWNI